MGTMWSFSGSAMRAAISGTTAVGADEKEEERGSIGDRSTELNCIGRSESSVVRESDLREEEEGRDSSMSSSDVSMSLRGSMLLTHERAFFTKVAHCLRRSVSMRRCAADIESMHEGTQQLQKGLSGRDDWEGKEGLEYRRFRLQMARFVTVTIVRCSLNRYRDRAELRLGGRSTAANMGRGNSRTR